MKPRCEAALKMRTASLSDELLRRANFIERQESAVGESQARVRHWLVLACLAIDHSPRIQTSGTSWRRMRSMIHSDYRGNLPAI